MTVVTGREKEARYARTKTAPKTRNKAPKTTMVLSLAGGAVIAGAPGSSIFYSANDCALTIAPGADKLKGWGLGLVFGL